MTNKKTKAVLAAGLALAAAGAHAQTSYVRPQYQYPDTPPASGPANI